MCKTVFIVTITIVGETSIIQSGSVVLNSAHGSFHSCKDTATHFWATAFLLTIYILYDSRDDFS